MRTIHALVMTIGCACGFAAYRGMLPHLNDTFRAFGLVYYVIMGMTIGTVLTGCYALALQRWSGSPTAMTQPGHWLLAFLLASGLANAAAALAYYTWYLVARPTEAAISPPYWVPYAAAWTPQFPEVIHQAVGWGLGALAAMVLCGMSRRWLPWHWWALFLVAAVGASSLAAGYIAACMNLWGRPASISWCNRAAFLNGKLIAGCLSLSALALARDAWKGRHGDALHWTGVSAWVVTGALQLALFFRYMYGWMPFTEYVRVLFTWNG